MADKSTTETMQLQSQQALNPFQVGLNKKQQIHIQEENTGLADIFGHIN